MFHSIYFFQNNDLASSIIIFLWDSSFFKLFNETNRSLTKRLFHFCFLTHSKNVLRTRYLVPEKVYIGARDSIVREEPPTAAYSNSTNSNYLMKQPTVKMPEWSKGVDLRPTVNSRGFESRS